MSSYLAAEHFNIASTAHRFRIKKEAAYVLQKNISLRN